MDLLSRLSSMWGGVTMYGSVRDLTDSSGTLQQRYWYYAYGLTKVERNQGGGPQHQYISNPFAYTSREWEQETGDYYNRARYRGPGSQFLSEDPVGPLAGDGNLRKYASNNPVGATDPTGLSSVVFNRGSGAILIYDSSGHLLMVFPASNNAQSKSKGPVPNGTYPFTQVVQHTGIDATPNGRYGPSGNFQFDVPNRKYIGIHAGRANSCDLAGRCGYNFATNGCIRTTNAGTAFLNQLNSTDPLTTITVQ